MLRMLCCACCPGNELTDLDRLEAIGTNYPPCTINATNVICVTATNQVRAAAPNSAAHPPSWNAPWLSVLLN